MKRNRRTASAEKVDGETPLGIEFYRGHVFKKWIITLAGIDFWRVDIFSIGLLQHTPIGMTQFKTTEGTMEKTLREAQKVVGWLIKYGADVPATSVPEQGYKGHDDRIFIMKSSTGKPSICTNHWYRAVVRAMAGDISLIVFNMKMLQTWMAKMQADGLLHTTPKQAGGFAMNVLLDSYAPICCWMGDIIFSEVLEKSNVKKILEAAREAQV